MSEEKILPDQLGAEDDDLQRDELEAKLASMPLPASRIDRDQLMYEAGYAAASRAAEMSQASAAVRTTVWPRVAGWSAGSAAVAAALAAAATLQLFAPARLAQQHQQAVDSASTAVELASDGEHTIRDAGQIAMHSVGTNRTVAGDAARPFGASKSEFEAWLDGRLRGRGPILGWRNGGRASIDVAESVGDGSRRAVRSDAEFVAAPVKSQRELLQELLPNELGDEPDRPSFWQSWGISLKGASI